MVEFCRKQTISFSLHDRLNLHLKQKLAEARTHGALNSVTLIKLEDS